MDDLKYYVAWTRVPHIGPARFRLIEQGFRSLAESWTAPEGALRTVGLDQRVVQQVVQARAKVNPDEEMERLTAAGVRAVSWKDAEYPRLLKEVSDPPPVLFVKGSLLPEDERAVTVVGTRRTTAYGRDACQHLVRGLAKAGCTIVSGLARGIDAVAHHAALDAGGRTIAVLGSGVDVIYPPEHAALAEQVVEHGALISELPLGSRPEAKNFPRRNRILSGLSQACLVVEAPDDSGALITVGHALEQGRDVFAVPGSIFSPASHGTNRLIQDGAKPILNSDDVLRELNLFSWSGSTLVAAPPRQAPMQAPLLEDVESRLLRAIGYEPVHIDEVVRQTSLPVTTVSSTLALLELKGLVKPAGGMHYLRAKEEAATYRVG